MATTVSNMLPHDQFSKIPGEHISKLSAKRIKRLVDQCIYAAYQGNALLYHSTEPVLRVVLFVEGGDWNVEDAPKLMKEFKLVEVKNYIAFLGDDVKALEKFFDKKNRTERTMDDLCLVIDFMADVKSVMDQ